LIDISVSEKEKKWEKSYDPIIGYSISPVLDGQGLTFIHIHPVLAGAKVRYSSYLAPAKMKLAQEIKALTYLD